ncbi:MAG: GNAT family N-acetyltransferase [bacterium]|nr:GNAT family N-acetyltransferase [bacterium]
MKTTLTPMSLSDRESVIDIFNYYVENSFAAYPERKLPYEFFDTLFGMCQGYPAVTVRDEAGEILGFGMLRPYNPMQAFSKTAEIPCFIKPDFTGQGIGKMLLDYLIEEGRKKGLTNILAGISSLNDGSMRFHLKNGFVECGRFKGIGQKQGKIFDVVYCQMTL